MIILYHGTPRKSSVLIKFFTFFQKNRPCPEVVKLEGTPSVFAYLIGNNFTFFIIISL
uniref:Uncharacterized protein n=1 Tax=Siphoviridae sp. ctmva1 TaxID=2825656 RepID=A0A8S5V9A9_9CAUD|nr:MAG TPA: hypothetical protein [Siphoviridae sp. ctmva1]